MEVTEIDADDDVSVSVTKKEAVAAAVTTTATVEDSATTPQTTTTAANAAAAAAVDIDFEALKTLTDDGIDMSFLSSLQERLTAPAQAAVIASTTNAAMAQTPVSR